MSNTRIIYHYNYPKIENLSIYQNLEHQVHFLYKDNIPLITSLNYTAFSLLLAPSLHKSTSLKLMHQLTIILEVHPIETQKSY